MIFPLPIGLRCCRLPPFCCASYRRRRSLRPGENASAMTVVWIVALRCRSAHIPIMPNAPQIAEVAALVGDPARANILVALLTGRALTATELAHAAGVSPQTTSGHLGKLSTARLVVLMKQGRHCYYRLA